MTDAWVASICHAARLALVIGIDKYQHVAPLMNARADADSMAAALRNSDYKVDLRTDRTLRELQSDIRAFRQTISSGDEVVVFFSGHGVQLAGTNYLLPIDVSAESEDQVRDDAIALGKMLEDIRERKPRFTLAIVDACRDNPFTSSGRAIGSRGLTGVAGATGQMVIYAAGEGQRALDRLGTGDTVRNGLFTRVFVREMARPGASVREVLYRVRDEVASLAESVKHDQVPAIYDQVRGNYFFVALRTPTPQENLIPARSDPLTSGGAGSAAFNEVFESSERVVFDAGGSLLSASAASKVLNFVRGLLRVDLQALVITGYAESLESDPQRLSLARSEVVKSQLVALGIEESKIYTEGRGTGPESPSRAASRDGSRRRADVLVVGRAAKSR